jgi:protein-export membrane protein SecD
MGFSLIPTLTKWSPSLEERATRKDLPWYKLMLPEKKINLGLDLQGGVHLVLGLDLDKVLKDTTDMLARNIQSDFKEEKIPLKELDRGSESDHKAGRMTLKFESETDRDRAEKLLSRRFPQVDMVGRTGTDLRLQYGEAYVAQTKRHAVDQSIQTIRNRIDEFGVREPIITRQGDDRISVEFPGIRDPARLKNLIGQTAKLEFKLVHEGTSEAQLASWVNEAKEKGVVFVDGSTNRFSDYLEKLNNLIKGKLPPNTEIAFEKHIDPNSKEMRRIPYLLEKPVLMSGEHVDTAYVAFDQQFNEPRVNMVMTPIGATVLARVSGDNIGRRMAIVLDGNIHSAPVLQSKIPDGRAEIKMGGGRDYDAIRKDAEDTSLVLRAGSLPTTLEFLEERTVGPELGKDAVDNGVLALAAGTGLVVIFMALYYSVAGIIADIAVLVNVFMILGILSIFDATLTAPGIAGILLTVGMAVDGNILIYERIREEQVKGASVVMAVQEGFGKALSSILDANITTLISGIVLYQFGTGPIKGFAVTLTVGIVTTVLTCTYLTRYLCDIYLRLTKGQQFKVGL